jgi:hypothetical protein
MEHTASATPVLTNAEAYLQARMQEDIEDATRGVADPDVRTKIADLVRARYDALGLSK